MTWCGHQGFQTPPNNPFLVNGKNMGNWGYEVGLSPFPSLNIHPGKKPEYRRNTCIKITKPTYPIILPDRNYTICPATYISSLLLILPCFIPPSAASHTTTYSPPDTPCHTINQRPPSPSSGISSLGIQDINSWLATYIDHDRLCMRKELDMLHQRKVWGNDELVTYVR